MPVGEVNLIGAPNLQRDPQGVGARAQHRNGLGVAVLRDEEPVLPAAPVLVLVRDAAAHGHRFGRGRRLIQQRGVGQRQSGQVGDQGLEIQQGL